MREAVLPILLGFLLGLKHAFEPDHLAAVAALRGRSRSKEQPRPVEIAFRWGAGHAASLLLAGAAVIFLGWRIPARLESILELAVAALLIFFGARILSRLTRRDEAHVHWHEHDGWLHAHLHFHAREAKHGQAAHDEPAHRHRHLEPLLRPGRSPFWVGMLHGLSGTGAATLLVLAASPTPSAALLALALFAAGTLSGMAALSWILGFPLQAAERRSRRIHLGLQAASGAASLLVGLALAGRILINF
ncbi:MAG TPA: high frequency lysogenization protein HflD [Candidatus Polarisedimenticolia bacterium]|nr:high frequency lysogenization protein HflD [Candidatus Polarisedimenticolia bacterium]